MRMEEEIDFYAKQLQLIQEKSEEICAMPGNTYFLSDGSILCFPRKDGDNRFPYGTKGFNFWTYASGYMHANDGLFSPFIRANEGQEPKIAFFAGWKGEDNYEVLSLLAVPRLPETKFPEVIRYTVFNRTCTNYITQVRQMRFAIRVLADEKKGMYFTVLMQNFGDKEQEFYLSPYVNPFLSNSIFENSEHRWFRKGEFKKGGTDDSGRFIFSVNEDLSRTKSVTNYGVLEQKVILTEGCRLQKQEATTSRYQYVGGIYSSLHIGEALKRGGFGKAVHTTAFNDTAIAGELLYFSVPARQSVRLELTFRYCIHSDSSKDLELLLQKQNPCQTDELVQAKNREEKEEDKRLLAEFGTSAVKGFDNRVFTHFFTYLKYQVTFCSLIKGYVQLAESSLIGIRDVFQAIEGMLYYNPEAARAKMLEALGFIAPNGRCPRQYALPVSKDAAPVMDLREFIDQGVWVINTLTAYLKFTGDFEILEESCGYYEIVDEKRRSVRLSAKTDSVLAHMLCIMDYLIQNQDPVTGCIRALYGDWNDALDGLGVSMDGTGEFGNGVSVMVTLQVYQNLYDMEELLQLLGGYEEIIKSYQKVSEEIEKGLKRHAVIENEEGEKRIVHGWGDRQAYYVGSYQDPDLVSRYGITSNAFWVISGLYKKDRERKEMILEAFAHLDSRFGLKTFEPYFKPDTPGVGRIYKLPPGTAENGAAYIHATAFGIMALFMMGEPEKAWEQLRKILPFTHEHISCSPYVMPNSYGDNLFLNIDGESMQDWQTGSSNVVLKILLRFVFGFQAEYGGFFLQPAAWIPFENYQFSLKYQNSLLQIHYCKKNSKKRTFFVNQEVYPSIWDEDMKIDKLWMDKKDLKETVIILIED
ncbi:GH36-type glycosyl hydrolase domain-containing protein [Anaerocolumna xylanovorans]|uniref:Glycosyl hydrolase 94 catalytic domain-containing protein n=1 Tax=Anaerocolumna xylanovorans DSM 12503 TaxID=1121345 RepID=A0A1M7YJW2_9FIRM|nr:hypothetical protein [Anaerocolumna xylanovorans]SHO52909.1 hypothetical protein SAMN02745217_03862 [Anaerocolumna xylanovorans DSM 12503]